MGDSVTFLLSLVEPLVVLPMSLVRAPMNNSIIMLNLNNTTNYLNNVTNFADKCGHKQKNVLFH